MVFDQSGSLANVSRHDYLPFGEELVTGQGLRSSSLGYAVNDGTRQHFTGYERDSESGLDYAHARYYANMQGRFTSPDPFAASAHAADPQSWNRYSYTSNNPVNLIDPSGMEVPKGPSDSKWLAGARAEEMGAVDLFEGTITNGMNEDPVEIAEVGGDGRAHYDDSGHEAIVAGTNKEIEDEPQAGGQVTASYKATYAQVPASGIGYYRSGNPAIEYGNLVVISELIQFAAQWHQLHPDNDIGIGEMSDNLGRSIPPHKSHMFGLRADIRPMRNDGAHAPVTFRDAAYNQGLTIELIRGLKALPHVKNILFNDPKTIRMGLTLYWVGHDNHLHVNFTKGWQGRIP